MSYHTTHGNKTAKEYEERLLANNQLDPKQLITTTERKQNVPEELQLYLKQFVFAIGQKNSLSRDKISHSK